MTIDDDEEKGWGANSLKRDRSRFSRLLRFRMA